MHGACAMNVSVCARVCECVNNTLGCLQRGGCDNEFEIGARSKGFLCETKQHIGVDGTCVTK